MKPFLSFSFAVFALFAAPLHAATTGNVIAIGDEWPLSNQAFNTTNSDSDQLAGNIAALAGGTDYLIATSSFAFGSHFEDYLTSIQGKTVARTTTSSGLTSGLATADAVFLAGPLGSNSAEMAALHSFVDAGGTVVVSLGTGLFGTPGAEAGAWNPFLNTYGMTAAPSWTYTSNSLLLPVNDSPLALDDGVENLVWGYGNQISLFGPNPADGIITQTQNPNEIGAIGVYLGAAPVPLPAGAVLLPAGLAALGAMRRRKRS